MGPGASSAWLPENGGLPPVAWSFQLVVHVLKINVCCERHICKFPSVSITTEFFSAPIDVMDHQNLDK